ncbi:MAG TPA: polyprenyl diphosphate synthase [Nitrososphaeraceae archaeon]|jgi:tritrans,polycis-undecaprenyl-diphosphate synthase [geranylgeranyl-diphosphate specific]|nr:polyprenyl diphosphate synthase [Nitrososphaeraceae archaeon]
MYGFFYDLINDNWFYRLYERKLESQIKQDRLPEHVAIILDGNRRWAKYHFLANKGAHAIGADKAEQLLTWIYDLRIKITTLYVLSIENLERDKKELDNIFDLLGIKLEKLYNDSRIHERQMKIKAIGNIDALPKSIKEILFKLEKETNHYDLTFLNIAIAYGGQQELVEAIRKIAYDVEKKELQISDINEQSIDSYLYTSHLPQPEPDLILRTSGEKRLSGFLLWQSAYSELVFMDVFWPEFRKIDLMRAIRTFQRRRRRYGK